MKAPIEHDRYIVTGIKINNKHFSTLCKVSLDLRAIMNMNQMKIKINHFVNSAHTLMGLMDLIRLMGSSKINDFNKRNLKRIKRKNEGEGQIEKEFGNSAILDVTITANVIPNKLMLETQITL